MSLPDFARTYRRWIIFSRSGLPNWSFKWPAWLRGIEFFLALALVIGAFWTGHPLGAIIPTIAVFATCWSIAVLQRLFGGAEIALRHWWVPFGLLMAAPFVYASSFLRPAVKWRGRAYQLDAHARLATTPSSAHP